MFHYSYVLDNMLNDIHLTTGPYAWNLMSSLELAFLKLKNLMLKTLWYNSYMALNIE